jgi:hypothetical protein
MHEARPYFDIVPKSDVTKRPWAGKLIDTNRNHNALDVALARDWHDHALSTIQA